MITFVCTFLRLCNSGSKLIDDSTRCVNHILSRLFCLREPGVSSYTDK